MLPASLRWALKAACADACTPKANTRNCNVTAAHRQSVPGIASGILLERKDRRQRGCDLGREHDDALARGGLHVVQMLNLPGSTKPPRENSLSFHTATPNSVT
eukprot:2370037-Rhodomonas_salina.1